MIDNSRREDLGRIADHLQCIGVISLMQLAFQHIRHLGSDAQDHSAMRGGGRPNGPPECRVSLQTLPWTVKVRHTVKHDVLAVQDRKSTRLNSSHLVISYAVF